MKIIEQFSCSKTGDDGRNEDSIAVTPHFVGVFDGVTSRTGVALAGMSTGRFAALTLAAALEKLRPDIAGPDAVQSLNATLKERAADAAVQEGKAFADSWSHPAAALLVWSRARREIWRVADSTFLLDGAPNYKTFPQEQTLAELRRAFLCAKIAKGATEKELLDNDITWDLVTPIIAELKIFANYDGPFGYGVLNGAPVPPAHIEVFSAAGAGEIVLASDGYPEVFPTLEATEKDLKRIVADDPLMYRLHPQVKGVKKGHVSFDDRSYIRFRPA